MSIRTLQMQPLPVSPVLASLDINTQRRASFSMESALPPKPSMTAFRPRASSSSPSSMVSPPGFSSGYPLNTTQRNTGGASWQQPQSAPSSITSFNHHQNHQSQPYPRRRSTHSHTPNYSMRSQNQRAPARPASSMGFAAQGVSDFGGVGLSQVGGPLPGYQPQRARFDPFEDDSVSSPLASVSTVAATPTPQYTHYYYYDPNTNSPTLAFADPASHRQFASASPSHVNPSPPFASLDTASFSAPGAGSVQGLGHNNIQFQQQNCTTSQFNYNLNPDILNRNLSSSSSPRMVSRSPSPPSPTFNGYPASRSPSPPSPTTQSRMGGRSPSPPSPGGRPGHVRRRSGALSLGSNDSVSSLPPAPPSLPAKPAVVRSVPAPLPMKPQSVSQAKLVSSGPTSPPLERPSTAPPAASAPAPVKAESKPRSNSIHTLLSRPLPASSRDTIAGIVASMLLMRSDAPTTRPRKVGMGCGAGQYVKSGLSRVVFVEGM